MTSYDGHRAAQDLPCHVDRNDPDGRLEAVLTDFMCRNGLCFSPDESLLYVADTGRMFRIDHQHIRVFDMSSGRSEGGRVFDVIAPGCADGIRLDSESNLWSSVGAGVHCIAPDGTLLGKIMVPEIVSNICFGGRDKQGGGVQQAGQARHVAVIVPVKVHIKAAVVRGQRLSALSLDQVRRVTKGPCARRDLFQPGRVGIIRHGTLAKGVDEGGARTRLRRRLRGQRAGGQGRPSQGRYRCQGCPQAWRQAWRSPCCDRA